MKHRSITIAMLIICCTCWCGSVTDVYAAGQSSADYTIVSDVFSGGGSRVESADYVITGTIGQPAVIGASGSVDYDVSHGFWAQIPSACLNHGDVNGSNTLTAEDAQITFFIVLGMVTPTAEQLCAADCDGSGSITAGDAQQIFFSLFGDSCVDEVPGTFDASPEYSFLVTDSNKDVEMQLNAMFTADDTLWIEYDTNDDRLLHIDLTLENPTTGVDAFTIEILFDPERYQFSRYQEGSIFSNWFEFDSQEVEPGRVVLAAFTVDDEIPQDSLGSLAHLTFEILDYRWRSGDFEFVLMDDLKDFGQE